MKSLFKHAGRTLLGATVGGLMGATVGIVVRSLTTGSVINGAIEGACSGAISGAIASNEQSTMGFLLAVGAGSMINAFTYHMLESNETTPLLIASAVPPAFLFVRVYPKSKPQP